MAKNKGIINISSANNIYTNTTGKLDTILTYKIPRRFLAQFRDTYGINLYLPTSKNIYHDGSTGSAEQTYDLKSTCPIVDSSLLTDAQTCIVYDLDTVDDITNGSIEGIIGDGGDSAVTIDYDNNQVTVNEATDTDIRIVYIGSTGNCVISSFKPSGGSNRRDIFTHSITSLHSMNQDDTDSLLTLGNDWPAPEKHVIKVMVEADWEVDLTSEYNNYRLAQVDIPFYKKRMSRVSPQQLQRINQAYLNK